MVTYPYAYMTYIVSPLAGLGGAYRGGCPPTALSSVAFLCVSCYSVRSMKCVYQNCFYCVQKCLSVMVLCMQLFYVSYFINVVNDNNSSSIEMVIGVF